MRSAKSHLNVLMLGESLDRQGGIVTLQKVLIEHLPENVSVHHIATVGLGGKFNKLLVYAMCLVRLLWRLVTARVDIVHLHVSLEASFYRQCVVAIACYVFGKPVIIHAHAGEFPAFFQRMGTGSKWLCRVVYTRAFRLILLTKAWQSFYEQELGIGPERLAVLPNPVALPVLNSWSSDHQSPCVFVHIGLMDPDKGTFDLIDAVAALPEHIRSAQIQLVIAGNGMIDEVKEMVCKLGLANCIKVGGWMTATERDELLSKSDVLVLPSYFEGMPMAILEAMSWSLPVLTTPVGGIPDLIVDHEHGLLIEPGNVQQLSQAIVELIQSPELRNRLGHNARKRMESNCPEKYSRQLIRIYQGQPLKTTHNDTVLSDASNLSADDVPVLARSQKGETNANWNSNRTV